MMIQKENGEKVFVNSDHIVTVSFDNGKMVITTTGGKHIVANAEVDTVDVSITNPREAIREFYKKEDL